MQYKSLLCSMRQIKDLLIAYQEGNIEIKSASKDLDFWYKKRTPADGKLDFSERTRKIYDLVRSVTRPFPGAFCFCKGHKIVIWKAIPFDMIIDFSDYQLGEIVEVFDGKPIIRTLDGSLLIEDYEGDILLERGDILE